MATYISTLKFTEKGISGIRESPKRAAAFKSAAKKLGVKVTGEYWTLGSFDGVIIFEAADDEAATVAMLALSSHGNVHTSTARAFTPAEMTGIIEKMA